MTRALPIQPRPSHVDLQAWAVEWHSRNKLDGDRRYLQWNLKQGGFLLFRTRAECRAYIEVEYGYLRDRPDLRREPFGWRMPQAVKVRVQRISSHLAERRGTA
jgi:hypothetical protein